jgi:hypothetical protein
MMQRDFQPTESRPKWTPVFLRELEVLSQEVGIMQAVHQTLEQDNISVDVTGEFERLQHHHGGILFVGDHKNSLEYVALMDILSRIGRDDMLNIAKFYIQHQVQYALGAVASRLVVPVYPRALASDRRNIYALFLSSPSPHAR